MSDLDKMARKILAAGYEADGQVHTARFVRSGTLEATAEIAAIRTALLTAPPGRVLVPVEPTQEMLDEVCSSDGIEPWTDDVMASTYQAMIAAAPEVKP